jgi:hypothetical protein
MIINSFPVTCESIRCRTYAKNIGEKKYTEIGQQYLNIINQYYVSEKSEEDKAKLQNYRSILSAQLKNAYPYPNVQSHKHKHQRRTLKQKLADEFHKHNLVEIGKDIWTALGWNAEEYEACIKSKLASHVLLLTLD